MENQSRKYLIDAANTATGRAVLRDLGLGAAIDAPERVDDASAKIIARLVREELARRYPRVF